MTLRILAIGDTANNAYMLSKFVKKSEIHIINFPRLGAAAHTYTDNVKFFDSFRISDQIKKINEIKNNFDLCFTTSWEGARVAYFANLNYIMYIVGGYVTSDPFVKNARVPFLSEPIHKKNFLERMFLKKILDSSIICITGMGIKHLRELQRYKKDAIRMDTIPVDTTIFNENVKPVSKKKDKFTFFSPQRMGLEKGMDVIWKALPLCKSDFDVLQVNWFDERTLEEKKIKNEYLEKKPHQIKLIPMIKMEEMPNYYAFADAVLGQMRSGGVGGIEREAAYCKRPVLSYNDTERKYLVNDIELISTYLPNMPGPENLAKIIDKIVEDAEFREQLKNIEYNFVKKISDPNKCAEIWDDLFVKVCSNGGTIHRKSSKIVKKFNNLSIYLGEKFIYNKRWAKKKTR